MEADFQQYYGIDVNDPNAVSFARMARLLFQLPRECRVFAQVAPATQWGWSEILANKANYLLETLAWMKTKDATKKFPQHKPKPFVPDFMPSSPEGEMNRDVEAHTIDEIREILAKPRVDSSS